MHDLLEDYENHIKAINLSPATIRGHHYAILRFIAFLERYEVYTAPDLRKSQLYAFQEHIANLKSYKGLPLKAASVNRLLTSSKGFLAYLIKKGYVINTIDVLEYVKVPQRLPGGVLAHKEVKKLMRKIDTSDPIGYRDRTIFELMYSSGMRAGELVRLKVDNIDFDNGTALIFGKGRKERLVPLGKTALKYVETYVKAIRPFLLTEGRKEALFLNTKGEPLQYRRLLVMVHKRSNEANIKINVTPHTFRRSCTTELVRGGANLYHVKDILGHADLQTLKHYTKLNVTDLRKTLTKCHPREKDK